VTDPRGHHFDVPKPAPLALDHLPTEPTSRRQAIAALLAADPEWLYALELFNGGYSWEAHEVWEHFWNHLGRTTPEARIVQGLIHLAAACVKILEGIPEGVTRHTMRARELLGGLSAANHGDAGSERCATLGLAPESVAGVLHELGQYRPECWHTSRTPVVRVLVAGLRLDGK
jgi:hypothetical protein